MKKTWLPFVSYNLWLQFSPAVGQEYWHCDLKRGFARVRKKESKIAELLVQDNKHQQIGHLAQRGIFEIHQNLALLHQKNFVGKLVEILQLNYRSDEVRERVIQILKSYQNSPILLHKNILQLNQGNEHIPESEKILIQQGNYQFNLFVALDCVLEELDGTIHILDFKTGTSDFDRRQAYVYLLAAKYLYPQRKIIASFYNLETNKQSEIITATPPQLRAIQTELARIARQHQKELTCYRLKQEAFHKIFPPNPGIACRYCSFNSICKFSISEVSV